MITKAGKFDRLVLLRDLTPALESAILRDVKSWEFKPATRDGMPVDIDVGSGNSLQPASAGRAAGRIGRGACSGPNPDYGPSPGRA